MTRIQDADGELAPLVEEPDLEQIWGDQDPDHQDPDHQDPDHQDPDHRGLERNLNS
jgi:hypothetical protein